MRVSFFTKAYMICEGHKTMEFLNYKKPNGLINSSGLNKFPLTTTPLSTISINSFFYPLFISKKKNKIN